MIHHPCFNHKFKYNKTGRHISTLCGACSLTQNHDTILYIYNSIVMPPLASLLLSTRAYL